MFTLSYLLVFLRFYMIRDASVERSAKACFQRDQGCNNLVRRMIDPGEWIYGRKQPYIYCQTRHFCAKG